MDFEAIGNLMNQMSNSKISVLQIEENGLFIRMEKSSEGSPYTKEPLEEVPAWKNVREEKIVEDTKKTISEKEIEEDINGEQVLSPMVGTFYSQAAPDVPAFVKVGDKVVKGQTLCIIEAMKLMNEIECEYDGEIAKILVENEEMVEYGQPLFIIK